MHLEIYGHVQGVAFRIHTVREARALDLTGWVRNRTDGSVELIGEGEHDALAKLEAWCHSGPTVAAVDEVKTQWMEFIGNLSDFTIRYGCGCG